KFPNGTIVKLDGKGEGGGGVFVGEHGTINIDRGKYEVSEGVDTSPIPEGGVHLYRTEDNAGEYTGADTELHIANWLYCIRHRETPAADVEVAHRATVLCHLGNIARWVGRELKWDAQNERFIGDDEAN